MLKPPGFVPSKRYPVLVFIYSEPVSQTVVDRWMGTETLYHRYLASLGYLVVSFDNAGTPAPRGRAWRKAVYGAIGVLSSKQQTAAIRWLGANRSYVDLNRVAVWGWSGGGTSTLNLMFRSPDVYKVGMAVAPVPDQRLYDTIYQERYMGLPAINADGYRLASPINFAEGLKAIWLTRYLRRTCPRGRACRRPARPDARRTPARPGSVPHGLDERFHVGQVLLERAPAGGGEAVFGARHPSLERLVDGDVLRVLELPGMHAQVAIRRLEQRLQLVERQPIVDGQRADDAEPQPLMDQPIEAQHPWLMARDSRLPAADGRVMIAGCGLPAADCFTHRISSR
jgi:pimeloyl-ACP methyl ester carboxylesterase